MNYLQKQNAVRSFILKGETTQQIVDRLGLGFSDKPNTLSPIVQQAATNLNKQTTRYGRTARSDKIKSMDSSKIGREDGGVPELTTDEERGRGEPT